ncbi:MAG: DsrE family protein [Alphaproteobacteria bacterium]|nr:DsrE family protein [Alphaproteobacteria bacterium]
MTDKKKLVVVITNGQSNERSSVGWSVANSGINTGLDVSVFLAAEGVDCVRKHGGTAQLNPLDPTLGEMMDNFIESGGKIMVCPACAKVRGYSPKDLIEGAEIKGSPAMHELIKEGAATLSF